MTTLAPAAGTTGCVSGGAGATAGFAPRPLKLEWPTSLPRHWHGGEVFATHLMDALSITFPLGEKLFIDSVRAYRERNSDPRLEAQIKAFISQEGWHRSVHIGYNEWLAIQGLPVERLERRIAQRIEWIKAKVPPRGLLAATVCLEHFTAMLAHELLSDPARVERMSPQLRRVWVWHALEELEHKAVAFDLFVATGGRVATRRKAMVFVTINFVRDVGRNLLALLRADGQLGRPAVWWQGTRFLFGRSPGLVWRLLPGWIAFFRGRFHPDELDDRAVREYAQRVLGEAPPPPA